MAVKRLLLALGAARQQPRELVDDNERALVDGQAVQDLEQRRQVRQVGPDAEHGPVSLPPSPRV
jgi:hypothetical protein